MTIIFLFVGLAFFLIGLAITYHEYRSRQGGRAVKGKIVGYTTGRHVNRSTASYHAVAQYCGPDGRWRLIESSVGSSSPLGRVDEERIVLVDPQSPDRAVFLSPLTYVLGAVFTSMGIAGIVVFWFTFQSDPFNLAVSAMITLIVAVKIAKSFRQVPLSLEEWNQKRRSIAGSRSVLLEDRNQLNWAEPTSLVVSHRRQMVSERVSIPILFSLAILCLGLAAHTYKRTRDFIDHAQVSHGRVIQMIESRSSDSTTFAPLVEFEHANQKFRFKHSISSKPPAYTTGQTVQVLFRAENPNEARLDLGLWNFAIPGGLAIMGTFFALAFLQVLRKRWRRDRSPMVQQRQAS